jgi:hypothetical protein
MHFQPPEKDQEGRVNDQLSEHRPFCQIHFMRFRHAAPHGIQIAVIILPCPEKDNVLSPGYKSIIIYMYVIFGKERKERTP